MPSNVIIRLKKESDTEEVAVVIRDSLNVWYGEHFGIEELVPSTVESSVYARVYDALDPNCCVVAEDASNGRLAGVCFFHPRPTHVALGIMNVAPDYFGQKIAKRLLDYVVGVAKRRNQPLRLVSSAMNLDSFSLYNRAGFVPRVMFQDMTVKVPEEGYDVDPPEGTTIRDATLDDLDEIVNLELSIYGIDRSKDYLFFIENHEGIWGVSVLVDDASGEIRGVMCSVDDPGVAMVGPGATHTDEQAAALIRQELNRHRGKWSPIFLIPTDSVELRMAMYALGARNTETHVAQSLGEVAPKRGVVIPTFLRTG